MGEVWRAHDARIGRDVAIKVLPEGVTADADRLARFEQEARSAGALNHPNILTVFELGTHEGHPYLVTELLEGASLRDKLGDTREGAPGERLPLRTSLDLGVQIASGLAAAHEKGIIHRDLKPENIFVTEDGRAKILDFGLAKLTAAASDEPGFSDAETVERRTTPGTVLGTPGYMAPEQVRGKDADPRADVFAFGAVLFEMLSGRRAFDGPSSADTISAILKEDPPELSGEQFRIPVPVERIVRRCLEKEPSQRFQSARDLTFALEAVDTTSSSEAYALPPKIVTRGSRLSVPWWAALAVVVALAGTAWVFWPGRASESPNAPTRRFTVQLPPGVEFHASDPVNLPISRDGTRVVFDAAVGETRRLYLRDMNRLEITPIAGTEGALQPCFAPDGRSVGFLADGKLKRVDFDGGLPVVVTEFGWGAGAWWGDDGSIVANEDWVGPIVEVPAEGGTPAPVTKTARPSESHLWPQALPDGDRILYTLWKSSLSDIGVHVWSRRTGETTLLAAGGSFGRLLPGGRFFYAQGGRLMAQSLDPQTLEPRSRAVSVLDDLQQSPDDGDSPYAISDSGTLVYRPGGMWNARRRIVRVDREGRTTPIAVEPAAFEDVTISSDGTRLALATFDQGVVSLYVHELSTGTTARITFDAFDNFPIWTPDGRELFFTSSRLGMWNPFRIPVDRSREPEAVVTGSSDDSALALSPDGERLLFSTTYESLNSLSLSTGAIEEVAEADQLNTAEFSPDGRWVAYSSVESGSLEVFIAPADGSRAVRRISTDGGDRPIWSSTGEIFYVQGPSMMVVDVREQNGEIVTSAPRRLFDKPYFSGEYGGFDYDEGTGTFVMIEPSGNEIPETSFVVVTDWFAEVDLALAAAGR
jgi:serine/threonine-protein kinase